MSQRGLNRLFDGAVVFCLALGGLRLAGVISNSVVVVVGLSFSIACMLFLPVSRGSKARTAVLAVLLVAVLGYTPTWAPARATADFYAATAQIIPVLLLVLALQLRLFRLPTRAIRRRRDRPLTLRGLFREVELDLAALVRAAVFSMTLLVLVVGELQALSALASVHVDTESPRTGFTAVAVGVIVVAFLALFGLSEDDEVGPDISA